MTAVAASRKYKWYGAALVADIFSGLEDGLDTVCIER